MERVSELAGKNGLIETTRPENARNVQEIMSVFLTETAQKPYPY